MTTDVLKDEVRRWRIEHGFPPLPQGSSLQQQADAILARPGARFPTGELNPRVVSREDARIISQVYPRVAEQQGRPGQAITGWGALQNLGVTRPLIPESAVERLPAGPLRAIGREAREMTSPLMLGLTAATAGLGPTAAAGLRGAAAGLTAKGVVPTLKRATLRTGAAVVEPVVRGGFGARMAAEQALGVGAGLGARTAAGLIPETAPTAVKVAAGLAGGLVGGAGAIGGVRALPALRRGAEEALVRAPGRVLPEAGLRLAGAKRVTGAEGASAMGRETVAYGPDPNKVYRMRYRVVEIDDLIPSHTDAFAPNPAYPPELQPRLRDRGAARLGVQKMARDLVPEALVQDSQVLDRGPMIVGADRVVESGNGRIMALRLARASWPERWQAYQQTLRDALPQFGIDEAEFARMRNPVLVRERVSDVDRVRFAAEANQPAVAVYSPVENALQDAKRIRFETLIVPEETQSLDVTLRMQANKPFIASFLETLPTNERGSLVDALGDLNLLGVQRVKAAMFARTYPGEAGRRLTQIFFESREPLIRNVEEGMMASLPQVARAEDLVRTGQRVADLSVGEDLAASLDMLARIRNRKMSAEQYLGQAQMFQRELTPFQEQLLLHMDGLARSPRRVREFLGAYADRIVASPHPQQSTMFAGRQLTKEDLFNATVRGQAEGSLFATVPPGGAAETPVRGLVAEEPRIPQAEVALAQPVAPAAERVAPARGGIVPSRTWETGAERPFAFDPNSTANQGRFRLLPAKPQGKYITRQSGTPGVSYIVDTEGNAIQAVRFNKAQFPEAKATEWWEANKGRFKFSNQAEVAGATRFDDTSEGLIAAAVTQGMDSISIRKAAIALAQADGKTMPDIVSVAEAAQHLSPGAHADTVLNARRFPTDVNAVDRLRRMELAEVAGGRPAEIPTETGIPRAVSEATPPAASPPVIGELAAGGAGSVERQRRRAEMMDLHARNLRQAYEDMVARGASEDEFQEMLSPLISVPLRKGETWKARAEALVLRGELLAKEASAEVAGVTPSTRAVPESIVSPAAPGRAVEQGAVVSSSAAATPPPPAIIPEESTAAGVIPSSPAAAPPGGRPPIEPPTTAGAGVPPADPIQSRPRTLLDMNREAKGMRAMTPEQRAAVMDLAEPIEGDILYQARPFNEHARYLLGPDTDFMKALRRLPGLKQIFGAWDPAQMARDNPQAMIGLRQSIFQEIEKARIRFVTLRWWHDAETAFAFKRTGTAYGAKPTSGVWKATTVKPASPDVVRGKMFGTINDMIEHPERYAFDKDQSRALYLADNTLTQSVRDAQRAGVDVVELTEDYWPRIVTKGPKGERGLGIARKRISSAKGYTRQRAFSDIDDLVEAGYTVETDPRRVLASRLEAGVDTIAHANSRKQIAALPGVEKPLERMERRFPQVLESARGARAARDAAKVTVKGAGEKVTTEQVMALRQAEADYITAMRDVYAKKIEVGAPGYYELRLPNGRIAPQELVEQVGKLIDLPELRQPGAGMAAEVTREVSQLLRTTLTNVDLAAGFIQGQTLVYRNNIAWWKAQAQAILALIDDPTAYVTKNFDAIDEGVRTGAIVAPTEFLFAKQGLASIPLRIPFIGPGLGAFNRAFEWFITAGQTELYKAARSGVAKNAGMDELVSLGAAIRKEVGTESYAILGVRPTQRTFEALSLFAARFFRANIGILGQSLTGGAGGAEARKAMGSLLAGGMAVTIGIKWAQDRELPNMTDPYAPDWMQWRWGKTYYNAYGPFYPYLRTMARVSVSLGKGNPMKAAGEIKKFLTSKESLPLRAIDIAGQLIYYGSANVYGTKIEKQWLSIVKGILSEFVTPISLQEIPSGIAEGRPESVLEFGGLIGRPVRMASEWAKDLQSYWDIPTNPLELKKGQLSREKYREANPEVDAKLFITGRVSSLLTPKYATGWTSYASVNAALALIRENDINPDDIKGIKARKERVAAYRKAGLEPPESEGVDRLIAYLKQTPFPTSLQPTPTPPTPVPQVVEPTSTFPGGWTEEQKRWWTEKGLSMNFPTPTPVGAR